MSKRAREDDGAGAEDAATTTAAGDDGSGAEDDGAGTKGESTFDEDLHDDEDENWVTPLPSPGNFKPKPFRVWNLEDMTFETFNAHASIPDSYGMSTKASIISLRQGISVNEKYALTPLGQKPSALALSMYEMEIKKHELKVAAASLSSVKKGKL